MFRFLRFVPIAAIVLGAGVLLVLFAPLHLIIILLCIAIIAVGIYCLIC